MIVVIIGSKGVSCFFIKVRDQEGKLNNIRVANMKEKFGTHQLPTAELELRGAVAELISPPGRGIPVISSLLNVTRL